jgi:hypothetical protein
MPRPPRIPAFAIVASDLWTNPKVFEATPDGVLVFIFALTQNAKRGRTGKFPASELAPRLVAHLVFRDLDETRAAKAIDSAIASRLLAVDADEVFVCGWDEEWQRDELNAQQALVRAKYRTEKKNEKQNQSEKQIERDRGRDVVTTTADVVMTTSVEPIERGKRRKAAAPLADTWTPRSEDNALSGQQLENELAKFRDYAKANDWRKVDWDATWRNWQRSASERSPSRRPAIAIGSGPVGNNFGTGMRFGMSGAEGER